MIDIKNTIDYLKSDNVVAEDAIRLMNDEAALIRVNAIDAITRLAKDNEGFLDYLADAARSPRNRVILMGTIRVSYVALANIFRLGTLRAKILGTEIIESWVPDDRDDLVWYLRSEGIEVS
jgi:hypothetical protein